MMPGYLRRPSQIPEKLRIQRQPFALAYRFGLGFGC